MLAPLCFFYLQLEKFLRVISFVCVCLFDDLLLSVLFFLCLVGCCLWPLAFRVFRAWGAPSHAFVKFGRGCDVLLCIRDHLGSIVASRV